MNHAKTPQARFGHSSYSISNLFRISTFGFRISILLSALSLCSTASAQLKLSGHTNVVSGVQFTKDGKQLVSSSWDRTLRIWNATTGKSERLLEGHTDWVLALRMTNHHIYSASQNEVKKWSLDGKAVQDVAKLGGATVNTISISGKDATTVVSGGRTGKLRIWGAKKWDNPMQEFSGYESWISCTSFSPRNQLLATGTRIGRIKVHDLRKDSKRNRELQAPSGHQIMSLAIHPTENVLATGDQLVRLWDLEKGKLQSKITGHRGIITAIAWSPDGKTLATGERHGTIKVWDYSNGNTLLKTLPGHSDKQLGFTVTWLSFSHDGQKLASASYDKTIKIWKLDSDPK